MISSPAMLDACRRCGSLILRGQSEGMTARADPTPLDRRQELAAILAGLATYDVRPLGLPRQPFLGYRCSFRILSANQGWKVVAEHRCPPGPHTPQPPTKPIHLTIPCGEPIPDNPPF